MKCLMVAPENTDAFFTEKEVTEYRAWGTEHRGDIFIGCKGTSQSNPFICAVASLDDVIFDAEESIYEWHLSNVRSIKPLPVKEQLRLFDTENNDFEVIDANNEAEVNAAYDAAESWMLKKKSAKR